MFRVVTVTSPVRDAPPLRRAGRCGVDVELRAVRNHGRDWPAHWHADLQIIATLEGEAKATLAGRSTRLTAGSLLVVPPRIVHTAAAADRDSDWVFLSMHVAPQRLAGWEARAFAPLLASAEDPLAAAFTATVQALFSKAVTSPASACDLLLQGVGARLAPSRASRVPAWLEAARLALEADLAGDLDIARVAARAERGRRAFERAFRTAFHLSPAAWRAIARVEAAKARLRTHASVSGAAAAAGFSDARRFSSTFRRVTGLAPRTYRQGFAGA